MQIKINKSNYVRVYIRLLLEFGKEIYLTSRELDVYELLLQSKSKKEIKTILRMSTYQLNNIYQTLRNNNLIENGKPVLTVPEYEKLLGRKAIEFINV